MLKVFSVFGLFLFFCSCSDNESVYSDDMSVKLFVEVGGSSLSKTVTSIDGSVDFSENDIVGMFTEDVDNPFGWTYNNGVWETGNDIMWENRTDEFEFLAYYPCNRTEGVVRTSVPMPDLSVQSGNINDVGLKDFLIGKCIASYSDNNGFVSFSGTNSFKHVYSLLHLNVINEDKQQSFFMKGCTFSGKDIATPHVYSFDPSYGGMKKSGTEEISVLQIGDLSSLSTITVLINPVTLQVPLRFTLKYTYGDIDYEASADLGSNFTGGSLNKITLRIVDGNLVISGNMVDDWNVMTLDDVILNGTSI